MLCKPREHARADFVAVVKGEDEIGPAVAGKDAV
jgi:hypothetical protein